MVKFELSGLKSGDQKVVYTGIVMCMALRFALYCVLCRVIFLIFCFVLCFIRCPSPHTEETSIIRVVSHNLSYEIW